jgi:hypothetical protein
MDAKHAKHLIELGREGKVSDDEAAFVKGSHSQDDLAEALAESAVASMNSGEDELGENLNAELDEERGGLVVTTAAGTELAEGTDESNIEDATR